MSIVRHLDKKSGRTLVYESTSHYDPKTKQSRPTKKYLGMLDDKGELIPSSGRKGRRPGSKNLAGNDAKNGAKKAKSRHGNQQAGNPGSVTLQLIADRDAAIAELKRQIADLSSEVDRYRKACDNISGILHGLH